MDFAHTVVIMMVAVRVPPCFLYTHPALFYTLVESDRAVPLSYTIGS